jgi:hypothetical protein
MAVRLRYRDVLRAHRRVIRQEMSDYFDHCLSTERDREDRLLMQRLVVALNGNWAGITFPHCNALALHAPGECDHCNGHPDWQDLRRRLGYNFTNHNDFNLLPDPALIGPDPFDGTIPSHRAPRGFRIQGSRWLAG